MTTYRWGKWENAIERNHNTAQSRFVQNLNYSSWSIRTQTQMPSPHSLARSWTLKHVYNKTWTSEKHKLWTIPSPGLLKLVLHAWNVEHGAYSRKKMAIPPRCLSWIHLVHKRDLVHKQGCCKVTNIALHTHLLKTAWISRAMTQKLRN